MINQVTEGAVAAATVPTANTISPSVNTQRRLTLSENRPASALPAANGSRYPVAVHPSAEGVADKSRPTAASTTVIMLLFSTVTIVAATNTPSINLSGSQTPPERTTRGRYLTAPPTHLAGLASRTLHLISYCKRPSCMTIPLQDGPAPTSGAENGQHGPSWLTVLVVIPVRLA